jgi:hypothetical protein
MIDLTPFLATEHDPRVNLRAPWRCPDGVCATNGHVLVCVPDDGGQHADGTQHLADAVAKYRPCLDQADRVWAEVAGIELPQLPECKACDGRGHNYYFECDDCDGKGEFDHGRHTYQCQECKGEGRIKTSEKSVGAKKESCWRCDGTGRGFASASVEGVLLQTKYLELIKALPGCVISTSGFSAPAVFRFEGGFGLLMPCRD